MYVLRNSSKLLLEKEVCYFILFKKDEKTQKNRESNEFFFQPVDRLALVCDKKEKNLFYIQKTLPLFLQSNPIFDA